jgi:hypothetical protein
VNANNTRKAGSPTFPKKGPKLRLVKSPGERPRIEPASDLKAIIEEMNRRRARRERLEPELGGKDAA